MREEITRLTWNEWYQIAKKYYDDHQTLEMPAFYKTEEGYELGRWISRQRLAYANRSSAKELRKNAIAPLTDEQVELLENIGMIWEARKKNWQEMFEIAATYRAPEGELRIPPNFVTPEGIKLGVWLVTQRQAYKNRKIPKEIRKTRYAPLTDEQVRLLESIGMIWDIRKKNWKNNFELIQTYHKKHGETNIPISYTTEEGVKLGRWLDRQRDAYDNATLPREVWKKSAKPLDEEQIKNMESLEFAWQSPNKKVSWQNMYKLAQAYYNKHNHLKIVRTFLTKDGITEDKDGYNLGKWINEQRTAYRNSFLKKEERANPNRILTENQIILLESIGMIWNIKKNREIIIEFCITYGIDYEKNKRYLENKSYQELYVKTCFLKDLGLSPTETDGTLHEIYFMSDINMQANPNYNISMQELIRKYNRERRKG